MATKKEVKSPKNRNLYIGFDLEQTRNELNDYHISFNKKEVDYYDYFIKVIVPPKKKPKNIKVASISFVN